jgi:hypothetical protein
MYAVKVWVVSHVKMEFALNISQILSPMADVMNETT